MLQPRGSAMVSGSIAYASSDGGATWRPTLETPPPDALAREYITIDHSGWPYHGRIHVNGNARIGATAGGLTNFWSSDGGRTFTESILPG